jgi:uncharacterized protein YjbI with pentapeptide repeats
MRARFRSWWQQIKQHRVAIGVVGIVLVVVVTLIIVGYLFDWTGFNGYNKVSTLHTISGPSRGTVTTTEEYQPGKTLWDWLQLLIIPLVLAVAALLFNRATTRTEQKIASNKQREDLLQTYLDRMSELLLEKQLHSPASPYEIRNATRDEVRNVARVRTITILFQLDARRIGYVFAFLREAGLMSTTSESIVSLKQANLNKINFSQAVITEVDLRDTNLSRANLSRANLNGANLNGANLNGANLNGANLSRTILREANLSGAFLMGANLSGAYLYSANLSRANLYKANLSRALLMQADLSRADLEKAQVTQEQLAFAQSLKGATLPDGSIHP